MTDPNSVDPLAIPTPPQPMDKAVAKRAVVLMLLDETGSMKIIATETVEGVNAFFGGLQKDMKPDEAMVACLKFDRYAQEPTTRALFTNCQIGDWRPMLPSQYNPRGFTPLYDAIGLAVAQAEYMLDLCKQQDRVADGRRVVIVIQTDGQENASKEFTLDAVKRLIDMKKRDGWEFVFLGADLPATDQIGASIGTQTANTMAYDSKLTAAAFAETASNASRFAKGQVASAGYTLNQRERFEAKASANPEQKNR